MNNNNDYTFWFTFMSLFNTSLGLSNLDKNTEQYERQIRIEKKIDQLLEMMKKDE